MSVRIFTITQAALPVIATAGGTVNVELDWRYNAFQIDNLTANTTLVVTHDINITRFAFKVVNANGFNLAITVNGVSVPLANYNSAGTDQEFAVQRYTP